MRSCSAVGTGLLGGRTEKFTLALDFADIHGIIAIVP